MGMTIEQKLAEAADLVRNAREEYIKHKESFTKNDLGVDCVSRQAVIDLINADWKYENLEIEINNLPSVTPIRPKGKWTKILNTVPCMNCPICGITFTLIQGGDKMHYCPNCGADMRGEEE